MVIRIMKKNRIVIKIGSGVLTNINGQIDNNRISQLCNDIVSCRELGNEILVVTSGAIVTGCEDIKFKCRKSLTLREKQAAAAIGQARLMQLYQQEFSKYKISVAQVLITRQDMEDRDRYLNAKNTLTTLLEMKVLPIINENDTIAVEEIKFGDNDTLAAIVATKVDANHLIILTNVDGIYNKYPPTNDGNFIPEIKKITYEIEKLCKQHSSSKYGIGGMETKLLAAKIVTSSGIILTIANGRTDNVLTKILSGEKVGTKFLPNTQTLSAKERWIAFGLRVKGKIVIDNGAVKAVKELNKSLLPTGVIKVSGDFNPGDMVSIETIDGKEVARGIVNYSSQDLVKIKGVKTSDIRKILGYNNSDEVIHCDKLAII